MENTHGDSSTCKEKKIELSDGMRKRDDLDNPAKIAKLAKEGQTDKKPMKPPRSRSHSDFKHSCVVQSNDWRSKSTKPKENVNSTVQELQNALFILNNRYTSTKLELEALGGTRKKQKPSSMNLASKFLKKRVKPAQNDSRWDIMKSLSTPSGQKKDTSKNETSSEEEPAQMEELGKFQTALLQSQLQY